MPRNIFNSIKLFKPKRNVFDLTHDVKFSMNLGELVPCMLMDCVPGDKFKISGELLLRFQPLLAPVMHRLDMTVHYYFVPYRILWPSWEKFIVRDSTDTGVPVFPTINLDAANYDASKLSDYLGIPKKAASFQTLSALPYAAYQRIYHEYYRDQNLVIQDPINVTDGDNAAARPELIKMRRRAWEHDYFTAALPFAQKGEAVTLPVGQIDRVDTTVYRNRSSGSNTTLTGTPSNVVVAGRLADDPAVPVDALYAATGGQEDIGSVTVNDLRKAYRLQEWLEKNARGGTRYIESILTHFGVKSSDKRLQRPEYITGVKSPVVISEVLQTSDGVGATPQGNMAGHGISVAGGKMGSYYCEEHGIIMGIMSVMPKPAYMQGVEKMWYKRDPLDFFWPSFANLGEQEVLNKELYVDHTTPDGVFGYVPRYSEYKFMNSRVCGDFRDTLNFWHFARLFENDPQLNETFIECFPDARQFAVNTVGENGQFENLLVHCLNKVHAIRPMPVFGTPIT